MPQSLTHVRVAEPPKGHTMFAEIVDGMTIE